MTDEPKTGKPDYELADVIFPKTGPEKAAQEAGEAHRRAEQVWERARPGWRSIGRTSVSGDRIMADKENGPGEHAEAGTAGEARKAADTAPRDDRDRWEEFSKEDAARLAKERKAGKR